MKLRRENKCQVGRSRVFRMRVFRIWEFRWQEKFEKGPQEYFEKKNGNFGNFRMTKYSHSKLSSFPVRFLSRYSSLMMSLVFLSLEITKIGLLMIKGLMFLVSILSKLKISSKGIVKLQKLLSTFNRIGSYKLP